MIPVFSRRGLPARAAALLALALLAACGSEPTDEPAAPAQAPPTAPVAADPAPETVARNLVAVMLSIEPARVEIVSAEAREFSDGSLDCPEPGMSYAQVVTPGHRVMVEADGRRFDVRVAGRAVKICHRQKPPSPGTRPERPPADGPGTARR